MTKYFNVPFANGGDKTSIPDALQPNGNVSFEEGWTPDYAKDQTTDPDAKDIPRQSENYFKFTVTESIKEIQEYGYKKYDNVVNYPIGARTLGSDFSVYRCLVSTGPDNLPLVDPVGDLTGTWVHSDMPFNNFALVEWFDVDGVSDDVQINEAINSLPLGGTVFLSGASYNIDASIIGQSNINFIGIKGLTTINITTPDIDAFSATSKTNINISGIEWIGTGANDDLERLIYFESCTDIKVEDCTLKDSIIGIQFQTCTRGKASKNTFLNLLRKTSGDQGYGILGNLDNNDIQVHNNSFNGVERHCTYFTSGSSNITITDNVAVNSKGGPYAFNCDDNQNTMRNIKCINNTSDGIQVAPSGTDDIYGVIATGNIDGLIIKNNQLRNNDVGGGILAQRSSTAIINPFTNLIIDGNIIDTVVGGDAITVVNVDNLQITGNQAKNIDVLAGVFSGISVAVSGVTAASGVDTLLIENNIMDTGKYSLSIAGTDASHKVENCIIGDNFFKNATSGKYNMSDVAFVDYATEWEAFRPQFYVNTPSANQSDVVMTQGHGGGGTFVVPFDCYIYATVANSDGTIGAGSITFEAAIDGAPSTVSAVVIAAGDLYEKNILGLGSSGQFVAEGTRVGMVYSTTADFAGTTRDYVAEICFIRSI